MSFLPAIVIVAYNRPDSLKRVLKSINNSFFPPDENINLIISIDYQNSHNHSQVVSIAENFEWIYGNKEIIEHKENLGLKNHIISCGDLSFRFESVIILEDDLIVSPFFYNYASKSISFYKDDENIAGVSLYAYEYEELNNYRFYPLNDGMDTYFIQWASSWGQAWTNKQWKFFKDWYFLNEDISGMNISNNVKNWTKSWKKYFIAYLSQSNKYFAFPFISYTTLIDEGGVHFSDNSRTNQVSLVFTEKPYSKEYLFSDFDHSLSKYDSFFEPISRELYLEELSSSVSVEFDFYGTKDVDNYKSDYIITIKDSKQSIHSFSNVLIPYELNIINSIKGNIFNLVKTEDHKLNKQRINYYKLFFMRKIYFAREMIVTGFLRVIKNIYK